MSKKYTLASIVLSLILTIFLGAVMPKDLVYKQNYISVKLNIRTVNDIDIKFYYADSLEGYSEAKCQKKSIYQGTDFEELIFDLPVSQMETFRVDFEGEVQGVDIKSIEIYSKTNSVLYDGKDLEAFDKNDILGATVVEDYLSIEAGDVDPFIARTEKHVADPDKSVNYRIIVMIGVFIALLAVLLLNKAVILDMLLGIWTARKQIKSLAVSDFKSRFSGSYLGVFWGVLQPIMTILLFWFVFQVGFKSQPMSNAPFILWLVAGMIPWNFFSDAWMNGNGAFTGYSYIVKKLVFNIDILPLVKILASSIMNIIFNTIIIVVYALYGRMPVLHLIDMLYYSICLTALALGLSMITSTLNVFMKDVGQFLNIAMQFIMWLTPIMWDYNMLSEKWSWFYRWNPLFYVINGYRESLIDGKWFFSSFYMMLWFWAITILLNIVGIRLMKKLKPHFADVL